MINSKSFLVFLYSLMAGLHFLMACIYTDNKMIFISQLLASFFWLFIVKNEGA